MPSIKATGAKYLAGGFNNATALSGASPANRIVLLQFEFQPQLGTRRRVLGVDTLTSVLAATASNLASNDQLRDRNSWGPAVCARSIAVSVLIAR